MMEYRQYGYGVRKNKNALIICGSVFFIVGLVFLVIGIVLMRLDNKKRALCSGEAKGVVVRIDSKQSTDSDGFKSTVYAPVVSYTVNGKEYEERSSIYSSPCKFNEGDIAIIHYDPGDPSVMIIEGDNSMKLMYWIFMGMGGIFAITGAGLLIFYRKNSL